MLATFTKKTPYQALKRKPEQASQKKHWQALRRKAIPSFTKSFHTSQRNTRASFAKRTHKPPLKGITLAKFTTGCAGKLYKSTPTQIYKETPANFTGGIPNKVFKRREIM